MVYIYLKNRHLPSRNYQIISGKGVPLLLNSVLRNPIIENDGTTNGSGIVTKSNVIGGILANRPKANPPPPSKQALTPLPTGGSLLERVSIPQNKKIKKENRNNIKLVL